MNPWRNICCLSYNQWANGVCHECSKSPACYLVAITDVRMLIPPGKWLCRDCFIIWLGEMADEWAL